MLNPIIVATTTTPSDPAEELNLGDPSSVAEVLRNAVEDIVETFVASLPIYVLALVTFVLGILAVHQMMKGVERGLTRAKLDVSIETLTRQVIRTTLFLAVFLLALSVAGVEVGAALAGLGIAGLALAFALQNILENFIAGILILMRRPFKVGDLISTNDFEGFVHDINLRVTKLHDIHGEVFLIPNAQVFANPITNLSQMGRRRTAVFIGIDYRDDHTIVPGLLLPVVAGCEGVMSTPEPDVMLTELGDSSVNFRIRFWTRPDPLSIARATSDVLMAAKSAVEAEGMTIPWPIRTLAVDDHASLESRP